MKKSKAHCELNAKVKNTESIQRVSTGNGSSSERASWDKSSLNDQVQLLVSQEEKLIKDIKAIEKRILKLKVNANKD